MTSQCKWCIALVVCAFMTLQGVAQKVAITSSVAINANHKMDAAWADVATDLGYDAEIYPISILSNSNLAAVADILIISNGLTTISAAQQANILDYLKNGGHIYIQSEYLSHFDTNVLFEYLINKTSGGFQWLGHSDNDLGPVNLINGLEQDINTPELDYFWYGAYGCGNGNVLPIIELDSKYYGFYYSNPAMHTGNIITQTDHDWIRKINDNHTERKALMTAFLEFLLSGMHNDQITETPTIVLDPNFNACTDEFLYAEVTAADSDDIFWYVNSLVNSTGSRIDVSTLAIGDTVYATISSNTGCATEIIKSDYTIITSENYTPNKNTTLTGTSTVCPGTTITIQADYDQTLPQVTHNWYLNGRDTPIATDYYSADDLAAGDILEHSMTYFDGCQMVTKPTDGSITIQWTGSSEIEILIEGQTAFCTTGTTAELSLTPLTLDDATTTWYVDGIIAAQDVDYLNVPVTDHHQEVFATVKYYDACAGWMTITSPARTVGVYAVTIETMEIANIDCENTTGFIEVTSSGDDISYSWNNGETGSYISNLQEGTYTVTASNATGCQDSKSFEITKTVFPLLDTFTIVQPSCNQGDGIIELALNDNDINSINVKWINSNGQVISTAQFSNNLPAGNYTVEIDAYGNCVETHEIEIFGFGEDIISHVDTITVERNEVIKLQANMTGHENYLIEWIAHEALSCTTCNRPEFTSGYNERFSYYLISPEGCKVKKEILVMVIVRDPYFAPSAFSPNNDGMNDYYKIHTRSDVHPTSDLKIFDRWGSLIHEEDADSQGWDGKSFGQAIQKGIFVFLQEFEDELGEKYIAKGSITVL